MTNWNHTDWLLGRQYLCRFRVARIGALPEGGWAEDRPVTLYMYGAHYTISLGELRRLIESGFVVEDSATMEQLRPGEPDARD
jgi:hypothetical protein